MQNSKAKAREPAHGAQKANVAQNQPTCMTLSASRQDMIIPTMTPSPTKAIASIRENVATTSRKPLAAVKA